MKNKEEILEKIFKLENIPSRTFKSELISLTDEEFDKLRKHVYMSDNGMEEKGYDTIIIDNIIFKKCLKGGILRQLESEISEITKEALKEKVESSGLTEESHKKVLENILNRFGDDLKVSEKELIKVIKEESDILKSDRNK